MQQQNPHFQGEQSGHEAHRGACPRCGRLSASVPSFLTKTELAEVLKKSPRWVEIQVKENSMPALKVGGTWRFELHLVLEWLEKAASTDSDR